MALFTRSDAQGRTARWIAATLVLTGVMWLAAFVGLLAIANRVHVDIPVLLARKLPLLDSRPTLIFAGESRTEYQVDAELAVKLADLPRGGAVNIGYDAGEPLAVLAAIRRQPEVFAKAHVVISVAPFLFNEGVKSAAVYPQDVAARLGVAGAITSFLPLRIGTLIRFIREAFNARLAASQGIAARGAKPSVSGLSILYHTQPADRWPAGLAGHAHYENWNLSGPKARFETVALCDMASLVRKLTVVIPPWAPRYVRSADPVWAARDDQVAALMSDTGRRCGFDVLNIAAVPGLAQANYADEMHVNASGIPIYTRYLLAQIRP